MKVQEAKTHLSALLVEVERGTDVVIARGDRPVARLTAIGVPVEREMGFVSYAVPESFFDPLPESELEAWES